MEEALEKLQDSEWTPSQQSQDLREAGKPLGDIESLLDQIQGTTVSAEARSGFNVNDALFL